MIPHDTGPFLMGCFDGPVITRGREEQADWLNSKGFFNNCGDKSAYESPF